MHPILNHQLPQNFRYPYLGLRRHQRLVQVKSSPPLVLRVCSAQQLSILNRFSGWSALESPNLGSFGISQVQPLTAMFADVHIAHRMMPATSAAAPSLPQL
jgi:hypothetical protein